MCLLKLLFFSRHARQLAQLKTRELENQKQQPSTPKCLKSHPQPSSSERSKSLRTMVTAPLTQSCGCRGSAGESHSFIFILSVLCQLRNPPSCHARGFAPPSCSYDYLESMSVGHSNQSYEKENGVCSHEFLMTPLLIWHSLLGG